jgi:hypothetical protein
MRYRDPDTGRFISETEYLRQQEAADDFESPDFDEWDLSEFDEFEKAEYEG